ncbi:MAG TPA: hypothetical protein VGM54_06765 [Chthoniobacter sp.]|jgi:hypothetical protein
MKVFFAISLVLLLTLVGVRLWLDREQAADKIRFENASVAYKAREADLLKSRAKALEAITKIVPVHGAKGAAPAASPTARSKETPAPDNAAAPPNSGPPE